MKPRIRYTLVTIGILTFIVFAPFIVLFVSGTRYDFINKRFIKTGIVAVKSDPRGASVLLDGKKVDTTPSTIRFVVPDEYDITLQKDGYFDWNKRLTVRAQYVTWLNDNLPAITMFYSNPKQTELASQGVLNFYADDSHLLYLTSTSLHYQNSTPFSTPRDLKLPKTFSKPEIIASQSGDYYLLHDDKYFGVYNPGQNKIFDISNFGSPTSTFSFYQGNDLFELDKGNLYHVFWQQKKRDLIAENILAYNVSDQSLYYITGNQIVRQTLYGNEQTTLLTGLPGFSKAEVLLTGQNQLFILGDHTLYALSDTLTPIADFVNYAEVFSADHKILFATGNEVSAYNIDTGTNFLITRSTKAIYSPIPNFTIGWTMFINDGRMQIIETDNRDHQNNYTFANVSSDAKFFVNNSFDTAWLLNKGKLIEMTIR